MLHRIFSFFHRSIYFIYKSLQHLQSVIKHLDILYEAIGLSLLSEKTHEKLIRQKYNKDKKYRSVSHTQKGLFLWEEKLVKLFIQPKANIVIIGAGGGREAYHLCQLGYRINAYETDSKMVAFANALRTNKNLPITFCEHQPNTIPEQKCDVFWFGWGLYTNVISKTKRIKMLSDAKDQISMQGYIIISYWHENRPQARIDQIDAISRKINKRTVEKGETFYNGCWSKFFTRNQIIEEIQQAGLKAVFISNKDFGHAVLQKR